MRVLEPSERFHANMLPNDKRKMICQMFKPVRAALEIQIRCAPRRPFKTYRYATYTFWNVHTQFGGLLL